MAEPTGKLEAFSGWDDPPWRAHTSASILIPDEKGNVLSHILIDAGAGVVDSLVASRLKGLENLEGVLISHWHPDHVLGLNQLLESLKRHRTAFNGVPVYCTPETYEWLINKQGQKYEFSHGLHHQPICHNRKKETFTVGKTSPFPLKITALRVAHGGIEGAVIYVAEIGKKKVVFGWDLDVPEAKRPLDGKKNIDVIRENLDLLFGADLLLMEANTWKTVVGRNGKPTGHTSYFHARDYILAIEPKRVYLVHLSGHEDGEGLGGYGWTDSDWEAAVRKHGVGIARQGMLVEI